MSPASTTLQTPAQAAHVQELQHHVSVKTLAFQTLQREYDDLSQELERQRTKYAALEMKFEASDVDINYLTDEKERLHAQVASLESQVEGLQESREEARRQQVANGAQYMRIVEMANRLQAQGSEDKRRWDTERSELEQRIRILEEAMVTGHAVGTGLPAGADTTTHSSSPPCSRPENFNPHLAPFAVSAASSETVNVLRTEIGRLRKRTQGLEEALQGVKQESVEVQAAAKQLLESGLRMEKGVQDTLGG
jgi:DNA repair exonuclease SbcCD ATPase subunit